MLLAISRIGPVALLAFVASMFLVAASEPTYTAAPQTNKLLFSAVTATTSGTANAIQTTNTAKKLIIVNNGLDKEVELTLAGADFMYLGPGDDVVIPLSTANLKVAGSVIIGVYNLGVAPTAGNISITSF